MQNECGCQPGKHLLDHAGYLVVCHDRNYMHDDLI